MDIEFVAASAAIAPKTALARIVFEGAKLEGAAVVRSCDAWFRSAPALGRGKN